MIGQYGCGVQRGPTRRSGRKAGHARNGHPAIEMGWGNTLPLRLLRFGWTLGIAQAVVERALQFQGFGGAGAGGANAAGVLVAQRVKSGGGQTSCRPLPSAFILLPSSLPGHSTRRQSSNVRWVCCWRDVISSRRRTKWGGAFSLVVGPTCGLARLQVSWTPAWGVKKT